MVAAALGDSSAAVLHASQPYPETRWFYGHLLPDLDPLRRYAPFQALLRPAG